MLRYFVFSETPSPSPHEPEPAQEPEAELRTAVPGPESRALRAREDAHLAPGLQGYALMAGIVVDEGRGSAVTDVDGNTLPRLHRRHQRQRARPLPPDVRGGGAGAGRGGVGRLVHLARARRARRAAGRRAAGAGRAPAAALLGRRRGGRERAPPGQVPHRQVRVRQLLGRLPRQDHGRAVADGLDVQGQARPDGAGRAPGPLRRLLPLPGRPPATRAAASPAPSSRASRSRPRPRARSRRSSSSRCRARPATSSRRRSSCPRCASLADELGALLIADEMITGLGRTGTCWGIDHTGVRPDIVTIGKAFGGGFPLSGLLTTDEIAAGQAVGQPLGLVVELRRQPARRGGRRRRAADHRRGEAGRERARRRRGAQARARGVRRSLPVRRLRRRARACSCAWSWSTTRRPRSRCRAG